ncbi:hypothetical protein T492DRAFT_83784 [Pavlovales sp. CCMP2436]|nr:hypothetical protein T492DRAFT_83784 [Pavlovales sp. CCMP2436]
MDLMSDKLVPGASGPPPDANDTTQAPQEDVEVRCHARATSGKMPPPRYLHTATCVDGERLFVYGGKGPNGTHGDVHILDMKASVWAQAKSAGDQPAPRYGHSAIARGSAHLIVFGGMAVGHQTFNFSGAAPSKPAFGGKQQHGEVERLQECEDELYSLDLESLEWKQEIGAKGAVPSPRYKHSATAVPGRKGTLRMYVFGGCDDEQVRC